MSAIHHAAAPILSVCHVAARNAAMPISRDRALALLSHCRGDEIWSVEHCRQQGVPEPWIEELADAYESGYRSDHETIYVADRATNQYHGIRDLDLAMRLGQAMGLQVERLTASVVGRRAMVEAIKQAIMEGD
jgi:hypothetical protein